MTKAILVGVGMAFLVGFVWSFIRFAGVMPIVIVGLLIGEVISQAVNRKRGTTLQFIAGGSTILALFIFMLFPALTYVGSAFLGGIIGIDGVIGVLLSSFFNALPSLFFNIFGLITIALGIYFSIYKFR